MVLGSGDLPIQADTPVLIKQSLDLASALSLAQECMRTLSLRLLYPWLDVDSLRHACVSKCQTTFTKLLAGAKTKIIVTI